MNTSQTQLNNLPEGDIELLSAYIDNQLGAAERALLDRRLGAEPRLRAELEEMRAAVDLLRDLQPVRPPRSFTLDPATAPRPRRVLPLAWFMQLGGGLAGFALVLLASLQVLTGPVGGMAGAPAPPAAMMSEAAPAPTAADTSAMMQVAEATQAPAATMAPLMSTEAPAAAAAQAAPEAPAAAESGAAPEATTDPAAMTGPAPQEPPAGDVARESTQANDATASDTAADPYVGSGGGEAFGTPEIAASNPSSPDTGNLDMPPPAPKSGPEPAGPPAGIIFGIGIALLAISLGSFLYGRARR